MPSTGRSACSWTEISTGTASGSRSSWRTWDCARHLTLKRPDVFSRIVAQLPSTGWSREALVQQAEAAGGGAARAWLSVGTRETRTDLRYPPTGMHQVTSQWDSVRRLAAAWGPSATLQTFEGGHEIAGWAGEIGRAVVWVMER